MARKKPRKKERKTQILTTGGMEELSSAQIAANEQMRRVLEEEAYSAVGSIVESDSEDEGSEYRGRDAARLDRTAMLSAMRKRLWMERMGTNAVMASQDDDEDDDDNASRSSRTSRKKKRRKLRRTSRDEDSLGGGTDSDAGGNSVVASEIMSVDEPREVETERDEGSIFGATVGSSNATWVECDKCKKVRTRLKCCGLSFHIYRLSHMVLSFQHISGVAFVERLTKRSFHQSGTVP